MFAKDLAIEKSFTNLVNAKSTIIGKIRSIKLLELIDELKNRIKIIDELVVLVRFASKSKSTLR